MSNNSSNYTHIKDTFAKELFEMVKGTDLSNPTAKVPIELYNRLCNWLEQKFGPANLRKTGEVIGEHLYDMMLQDQSFQAKPTPQEALKFMKKLADATVQDPLKRGFEILEEGAYRMVLRRTQTFHPIVQEGIMKSVVAKTGVRLAKVTYLKNIQRGDEFDEYEITWR